MNQGLKIPLNLTTINNMGSENEKTAKNNFDEKCK